MSLLTTLTFQIFANLQKQAGQNSPDLRLRFNFLDTLADGNLIDQANKIWLPAPRTLASGASEEIDLAGALTDPRGDAVVFSKVKVIGIHNLSTTPGAILEIGGAAANAFLLFKAANDISLLGPNGLFFRYEPSLAGIAVTTGTGDLLKIANVGATSIDYEILINGV